MSLNTGIFRASSRKRRQRSARAAPSTFLETLEKRYLLSGVTVITHGFMGNADPGSWMRGIADAIGRTPEINEAVYVMKVWDDDPASPGTILASPLTLIAGHTPDSSASNPEIVILVDWSGMAGSFSLTQITDGPGHVRSTKDVAEVVTAALLSNGPIPGAPLIGSLASLPFHLIGHSRGGALVAQVAYDLGLRGVWVDHVTTLDPHPVDGAREPSVASLDPQKYFNWGDSAGGSSLKHWSNISFFDNYWREDNRTIHPQDFVGELITGTYDRQLSESVLDAPGGNDSSDALLLFKDPGYTLEHSDVHLWYHGTIDKGSKSYDGAETVPGNWYGLGMPSKEISGFYFSRIRGGPRDNTGLSKDFFPGTGPNHGIADSVSVPHLAHEKQWPNLDYIEVATPGGSYVVGAPLAVRFDYQFDGSDDSTVNWYLDPDRNPFNNTNASAVRLLQTDHRSPQPSIAAKVDEELATTLAEPDHDYYLLAEINANGHTRYAYALNGSGYNRYAAKRLHFTEGAPSDIAAPHIDAVTPQVMTGVALPGKQLIAMSGSGFSSNAFLRFSDGRSIYDRDPSTYSSTKLTYDIKVGNETRDWTVTVINDDGTPSNTASFHVQSTGDPTAPGVPVGLKAVAVADNNTIFDISWSDPPDDSGFAAVWWKIGSPPTSNADGNSVDLSDFTPLTVFNSTQASTNLYVWLEDGAGNVDFRNYASVALPGNPLAPVVNVSLPGDGDYTTYSPATTLNGTAYVPGGGATVVQMVWSNSRGGTGTFTMDGPTSGYSSVITLAPGSNVITASAVTDKLDIGSQTITVNYVASPVTKTWTGSTSPDWSNPDNWSPVGVPGAFDRVVINSGFVVVAANAACQTLNLQGGTLQWTGGRLAGTIVVSSGATVDIVGPAQKYLSGGQIINSGTVIQQAGTSIFFGWETYHYHDVIMNLAGAVYDLRTDGEAFLLEPPGTGSGLFVNAGTLRRSGSSGEVVIEGSHTSFHNTGTIAVDSGTLTLNVSGFSDGGVFSFSNGGIARVVNASGPFVFAGVNSGEGVGALSLEGMFQGAPDASGSFSFSGDSQVNWRAGRLGGWLENVGNFVINPLSSATPVVIAANATLANSGKMVQTGTAWVQFEGFNQVPAQPATLLNLPGGSYEFQNDGVLLRPAPSFSYTGTFINAGVLRKSGGVGETVIGQVVSNFTFANMGSVEVLRGTLTLDSPSSTTDGVYTFANGGRLKLARSLTITGVNRGTGDGAMVLNGGGIQGADDGSGLLDFGSGSRFELTSGRISDVVTNRGDMRVNGSGIISAGATLINHGTILQSAGQLQLLGGYNGGGPAAIINEVDGSYDISTDGTIVTATNLSGSTFSNEGLFRKSAGIGVAAVRFVAFTNGGSVNALSGTVDFTSYAQTSGSTSLNGGSISATSPLNVLGGALDGIGTLTGGLSNAGGTVQPGRSTGVITVNGTYAQSGVGRLSVELNGGVPGSQFDQLAVNGSVSLGGTLAVSLGFAPNQGAAFTILSNDGSDPISGTFAGLSEGATFVVGARLFRISYQGGTGNDVVLTAIANPTALKAIVAGSGSNRSDLKTLTLSFDQPVILAAGAAKLELLNTGGSGANDNSGPTDISAALDVPTTADGGKTWVFTFAAGSAFVQKTSTGASTGSLVDGIYKLTIDPTKVTANGVAMTGPPPSLTFHRLFGDVTGDAAVNPLDYLKFRQSFGKNAGDAGFDAAFDFNGDGAVNPLDYVQFRQRFGKAFTY
jgi:hypothetical protein